MPKKGGSDLNLGFLPAHSQPWTGVVNINIQSPSFSWVIMSSFSVQTDFFLNLQKQQEKWKKLTYLEYWQLLWRFLDSLLINEQDSSLPEDWVLCQATVWTYHEYLAAFILGLVQTSVFLGLQSL